MTDAPALLAAAIARNAAVVLSLPSAGLLRHHKTRFLGPAEATDDPTPDLSDGLTPAWVETIGQEQVLINALIDEQKPCGISFRCGDKKVVGQVRLLRVDPEFRINAKTTMPALLISRPDRLQAVQRRNSYRVSVPADSDLKVQVWRIAEQADLRDRPPATNELPFKLRDLSIGGLGLMLLAKEGEKPKVLADERLRVELVFGEHQLIIEGRLKYSAGTAQGTTFTAGVQFQQLETDVHGRQRLAELSRIVGELQREEARRLRRGA